MTTISHVRGCQPQSMVTYAEDLTAQNAKFSEQVEHMDRDVGTAMHSWKGDAATAASVRAVSDRLAGNHLSETVVTLADHFNTFGAELDGYRTALLNIVDHDLRFAGMMVDDQGNVTPPKAPAGTSPGSPLVVQMVQQALQGQADGFQTRIKNLLVQFGDTESKVAQAITTDLQMLGTYEKKPDSAPIRSQVQNVLNGKAQLPSDPKQLHDFWELLTPAEKDALYQHDQYIGNKDGIPQVDRDHYNRMTLDDLRARAQAKVDRVEAMSPAYAGQEGEWKRQLDVANTELAGYDKTLSQIQYDPNDKTQAPRLLSLIDDRGHAAIALRNPDTAQNVVTYVPGTGSKTTEIDNGTQRAEAMRRSAELADPSKATSVVTWYGYDAPQSLTGDATKGIFADNAAGPLDNYQSGLRVTHDGPRAMDTVVGHSYGTTVIGHAASNGHTLDADNLVLVGSPGIGVDGPDKLNLTGVPPSEVQNHIYSTTAQNDPVRLTPGFIHGPQPVSIPGFGTTFESDGPKGPWYTLGWTTAAHSAYWDNGNPALASMANIINGDVVGK